MEQVKPLSEPMMEQCIITIIMGSYCKWLPFLDDIFKCICLNEDVLIPIKISRKFVPHGPINNIPALVHIMAWHQPGDKLYYLNQWWLVYWCIYASLGFNELNGMDNWLHPTEGYGCNYLSMPWFQVNYVRNIFLFVYFVLLPMHCSAQNYLFQVMKASEKFKKRCTRHMTLYKNGLPWPPCCSMVCWHFQSCRHLIINDTLHCFTAQHQRDISGKSSQNHFW